MKTMTTRKSLKTTIWVKTTKTKKTKNEVEGRAGQPNGDQPAALWPRLSLPEGAPTAPRRPAPLGPAHRPGNNAPAAWRSRCAGECQPAVAAHTADRPRGHPRRSP